MHTNPWKKLKSDPIYDNDWISVTEHRVLNAANKEGIYGEVHFKNLAIAILPLTDHLETYLVGQYRFPLDQYSWEIPMGGGPLDGSPLRSAQRELKEETGLLAQHWNQIAKIHTSNSVCDEAGYIYIAKGLTESSPDPDDTEVLQVKKLPFERVLEMALCGEITDAISLTAIFKTKILLDQGLL